MRRALALFTAGLTAWRRRARAKAHGPAAEATLRCGHCDSARLRRSRARSWREVARKLLTARRPYRCRDCGWRAWLDAGIPHQRERGTIVHAASPDFDALDAALGTSSSPYTHDRS